MKLLIVERPSASVIIGDNRCKRWYTYHESVPGIHRRTREQ